MMGDVWYSNPPNNTGRSELGGSTSYVAGGIQRSKDGIPIWSGDAATFEEYVESCLMYEQTVVREKRYLCGPRIANELKGPARRILIGRRADWLSYEGGVRALVSALREERGQPKIPEMSELLLKYFKGTRRQKGETMNDFVLRKAEAYTRAQQSLARYQQEKQGPVTISRTSRLSSGPQSTTPTEAQGGPQGSRNGEDNEENEEWADPMTIPGDDQQWGQGEDEDGWVWSYSRGWYRMFAPQHGSLPSETSEWQRRDLPDILPDFVQGWYLFMDSGLDTMERNVLQAELRGDFSVRAVESVLRKHWTDHDIKKRDQEKWRYMSHLALEEAEDETAAMTGEWSVENLEAEGYSTEEIGYMASEQEKIQEACALIQEGRKTLREARAKQHAVKMSRGFYNPSSMQSYKNRTTATVSFRDTTGSRPKLQCFRCGGPHKVAECKEKPKESQANSTDEVAPLVFLAEAEQAAWMGATTSNDDAKEEAHLTTQQVMEQGKAVVDGGATRTIGSVEALSRIVDLNEKARGTTGVREVDVNDHPTFGFGNSSRDRCTSTACFEVPMGGRTNMLRIHALDKGSTPVLLSIHSLRKMGAIIDFESDLAVFRNVDPKKLVRLERTSAGHQVMPLTDDMYKDSRSLKQAVPSFTQLE